MRILIFGGDERQISTAVYFKNKGADVGIFGIDSGILERHRADDMCAKTYTGYDAAVFPLPFSTDGVRVNCPFSQTDFNAVDVFRTIDKTSRVFAGMAGTFFKKAAREYGIKITDYYESEAFQISNAVPTAEGAIWTYMNHSKKTVFDSSFAVCGCGKVGRCLSDRLFKLGGDVTVAARSDKDVSWAESVGLKGVNIENFLKDCAKYDCIFNTVPCNVFDENAARLIGEKSLYIELASKPYGMNEKCASILGNRHIPAPSLPGRTAPESAGIIIAKTIEKYL